MTFFHGNRRTHLYLALFLSPWFLLYGVSSIVFSHNQYFDGRDKAKGLPNWTVRFEKQPYDTAVPEGTGAALRPFADRIVSEAGLSGSYGAYRQGPNQINVYIHRPFQSTQIKYFINEKRLVAEDARFRWDHVLTGMHAKGGFEQGGWNNLWAAMVDVVCLGFLLWIATGLYMWWHLPGVRRWGWLALGSGLVSFACFVAKL